MPIRFHGIGGTDDNPWLVFGLAVRQNFRMNSTGEQPWARPV
jgi:hypothetical protein